ncbi:Neuferricin-like protein [Aphelenchoides bicaudatus]|nr:Neuferricin-like protein [Aphelenchoides bicaudatus]
MPKGSKPPDVYTKSLIIISVNVIIISLLFTIYDIQAQELTQWTLRRIYKMPRVRSAIDSVRSLIGLAKLTLPKSESKPSIHQDKPVKPVQKVTNKEQRIFTADQLALFDGSRSSKHGIMGRVYDVEKGRKHYSANGAYHFFSGKDASRAFVTGDFTEEGLTDDISDFDDEKMLSLSDWLNFYDREYKLIGVVQGRFYDSEGKMTEYAEEMNERLVTALEYRKKQVHENEVFPSCNSEYRKETGTRVWCTAKSGGVEREWVGVPRKLYAPGSKHYRCACVKNFGVPLATTNAKGNRGDLDNPNIKPYENCSPTANSCKLEDGD